MKRLLSFVLSPIGSKIIVSLSGALIIIFLIGHALGNLLIFNSQSSLNTYAHWLQNHPFLWVFRLSMITLFSLHIFLVLRLTYLTKFARPIGYHVNKDIQLGVSKKTMLFSGLVIFFFLVFHLAHLTFGWLPTSSLVIVDSLKMIDVYHNIVRGFQEPWIALIYIVSIILIGLHLHHALKNIFQTLGFHHENLHAVIGIISPILILAMVIAFISIPISILFGFLS